MAILLLFLYLLYRYSNIYFTVILISHYTVIFRLDLVEGLYICFDGETQKRRKKKEKEREEKKKVERQKRGNEEGKEERKV